MAKILQIALLQNIKYRRLKQKESKWGINVEQLWHEGGVIWESDSNLVLTILHCTHENYDGQIMFNVHKGYDKPYKTSPNQNPTSHK
jgi:hypothetical protein